MPRFLVIGGGGQVGGYVAEALGALDKSTVTILDPHWPKWLKQCPHIRYVKDYAGSTFHVPEITREINKADVVISCVPSSDGVRVAEAVLKAGKPLVDVAFTDKNPRLLGALAMANSTIYIPDMGLAPGLSNMLVGYSAVGNKPKYVGIAVGGIPQIRCHPWEYSSSWNVDDIIAEYTRRARIRMRSTDMAVPPLSDCKLKNVHQLGTVEAFLTDGLRTLLETYPAIPTMEERTIRWPGYADKINFLKSSGFFDENHLTNTKRVLAEAWARHPKPDVVYLEVIVESKGQRDVWSLLHWCSDTSALVETTAIPVLEVARMVADGWIDKPGIHTPEKLGENHGFMEEFFQRISARNMAVVHEEEQ